MMVSDWISSNRITVMTPAQEGGYLRLLLCAWSEPGCALPDDAETLAELSRLRGDWPTLGVKVRACFVSDPERPGHIFNEKQRAIRAEQEKRIAKARDQRREAANSRWHRVRPQCDRSATASIPQCVSNASYSVHLSHNSVPTKSTDKASKLKLTAPQRELALRVEEALGDQWVNDAGKWVTRIKKEFIRTRNVVAEVEDATSDGRIITTPAQYAEQIWKEFK
jgi:uncharacterized protein YdaU (DUF1376 family)